MAIADSLEKVINLSFSSHERLSQYQRLTYPVISRRSGGLSLGVNLNPDKACNFNCVYCQVDRKKEIEAPLMIVEKLQAELEEWLQQIQDNNNSYRGHQLKDISIAGDGEPTTVKELPEILESMIRLKQQYHLDTCKLVLFSNGTQIDREDLRAIWPQFFKHNGEVWFKLDYWDEASLKRINRTKSSFDQLLKNLIQLGREYPLVLQSCFFSWKGQAFSPEQYQPYLDLIQRLTQEGVQIKLIQAYTLARVPAESHATPWSNEDMDHLQRMLEERLSVPIEIYYESGTKE
ncbi:MAG: hypothetical protein COB67_04650 [SAR324 cluster bacterium]|uniref:Radical SAM core domain-containing protein n=1 Tax=SAR324 cluster bacterium TaxID=2024889 RepID=A0A2A4T6N0_9DELT|nr:MAG: hypothetical protein COB67_04650 [SAR324 cluster bacterium]